MEFMEQYFDVKKGVRCIAGHKYSKGSPVYYVYDRREGIEGIERIEGIEGEGGKRGEGIEYRKMINPRIPEYDNVMRKIKTAHGFFFTFDGRVVDSYFPAIGRINYICSSIVGINYSIDLDAPHESLEKGAKRLDFFDYVKEFDEAVGVICRRLDELGEVYNLMFSGNGIYIMLGGYYEDIDGDVMNYVRDIDIEIENMKNGSLGNGSLGNGSLGIDLGNKLKVHIDNKKLAWNKYVKLPFQPHGNLGNRYSIPIPIGGDHGQNKCIDKEWVREACNLGIGKENIIKKANWKKIW